MPKRPLVFVHVLHASYRGAHRFGVFKTSTLLYSCLGTVLIGYLIILTTLSTVQKMSLKIPLLINAFKRPSEKTASYSTGASCQPLHFIPDAETRPVTALASFPGSGNTWLRHLIQQSTGALTGSEYPDEELLNFGFPGEGVFNASVAVVKTHQNLKKIRVKYQKAVLLIRHLKPALLAEFNRFSEGHTGCAPKEEFELDNGLYWNTFVKTNIYKWKTMNLDWINNFKGPLHIVQYDQLLKDLGPTLRSLVEFLDLPLNETAIQCIVEHSEGLYHRKPCIHDFDPFSEDLTKKVMSAETYVFKKAKKFIQSKTYHTLSSNL